MTTTNDTQQNLDVPIERPNVGVPLSPPIFALPQTANEEGEGDE